MVSKESYVGPTTRPKVLDWGSHIGKNFITSAADTASCVLWSSSGLVRGGGTILLISPLPSGFKEKRVASTFPALARQPVQSVGDRSRVVGGGKGMGRR